MRNFAEYVSEYVAERHLSWRKAAQLCQVDRTLLSRYASGKKLPKSMDKAVHIGKGLKMSPQQIEGLKAAYQVSRMGEYQYQALKSIGQLFGGELPQPEPSLPTGESALPVGEECLSVGEVCLLVGEECLPVGEECLSVGKVWDMQGTSGLLAKEPGLLTVESQKVGQGIYIPPSGGVQKMLQGVPTQRLYGKGEIYHAIARLARESSYLQLQMDATGEGIPLPQILRNVKEGCQIAHRISLSHGEKEESEIKKFHALLPILCSGREYKAYCSYQWHRDGSCRAMKMALGSQGMVLFTSDFGSGIYAGQEGYQAYYQGVFRERLKKCQIYGEGGRGAEELFWRLEKKGCPFWKLEHPHSGVSFFYQNLFGEHVFVRKEGKMPWCFYIEESELIRMFVKFMEAWGS